MKKLLLATLVFVCTQTFAQKSPEQMGGVYYAYPIETGTDKPQLLSAPAGYEPFYISHYGRHGSRWLTSDARYTWVNRHFEDQKNLTPLGKKVKKRLAKVWKNAKGNGGQLTALGARQHRGIARRMYQNFPKLFTKDAHITAHSSVVSRCRSSMLAFLGELGLLDKIEAITDSADMAWIAFTSPEEKAHENRTNVPLMTSPDRFVKALFVDPSKIENPTKLLTEMHTIASDMQDVELNVSLYDIFMQEELEAVYNKNNRSMTIVHGDLIENEGIPARSAISLWQRIETEADAAIARGGVGADLRFGHDSNLYRLMTLNTGVRHAPDAGVRVRIVVDYANGACDRLTVVVAVGPAAFGVVVAAARKEIAPAEIVVARGRRLMYGIRPDEVRRIFVFIRLRLVIAPVVDRRTLRPGRVSSGEHLFAVKLFRLSFRDGEQVDDALVQEIEIPAPEEPRLLNAARVGRKDVLRLFFRFQIR